MLLRFYAIFSGTNCNIFPSRRVCHFSMKHKILILATAAAIFAGGFTFTSLAADHAAPSAPSRGKFFERIAARLHLTDDQKAQIKIILAGEKDTLVPELNQLHDARKALRAAIQAGDATETSVRAASAAVATVEANLAVERLKLYDKIAPVLTAEQRQQIAGFEQRADDFADNVIAHLGEEPAQ